MTGSKGAQAADNSEDHRDDVLLEEFAEEQEQGVLLSELGCDQIQGFLISRPLPAYQIDSMLRSGNDGTFRSVA